MEDENNSYEAEWLDQAKMLSQALPFMKRYSDKTVVIKYGGHAMGDLELAKLFARDIVLLRQVGLYPIIVHGGGPQIGAMLKRLNVKSEFIDGLRVTDEETMKIAEMVLVGSINKEIVSAINEAGGRAAGLCGKDSNLIKAKKLVRTKRDESSNVERVLDLGLVGEPDVIDPHILKCFEHSDITPVIAPIGSGPNGETFNINADTAAGAIAQALGAKRLIMLTDVSGVLDKNGKLILEMSADEARTAMADGTISGGMIPKVETCLNAVDQGVEAAVISDGRIPHGILVEFFTPGGAGTMIKGKDTAE
ncbi:MAG: acetylglutamate kinase [Rhodospirillales bacterium]|jgi:acetylglutamate kinase|tara:strand:- start:1370 stop:2290 length:921 start_codon:yes stop_codon:yes gene_type:complete